MHGAGGAKAQMASPTLSPGNFIDRKSCFRASSWTYRLPSVVDFPRVSLKRGTGLFIHMLVTHHRQVFLFRWMFLRN